MMSHNKTYPLRVRASYWFDNRMAEGLWPKVRLLFVITIVFIIVIGAIAAIAKGLESTGDTLIKTLMYTLGKGGALESKDAASPLYFVMMLLTILYCIFFSSILIGLISNALRGKVDELGKGQSQVLESDHTLILGFNEATFVLVNELVEANRNINKPRTVVILGNDSRAAMSDALQKQLGKANSHPNTKIICRTGSIYGFSDLRRCSLETSHSVIVNGSSDFETVKAIMACSHILAGDADEKADAFPYIVAVVHGSENMMEATIAAQNVGLANRLEFLSINETLARIMVHTSRQPGLSNVFTELFNYSGHELYLVTSDPSFAKLNGKSIEEINRMLKSAVAIGKRTEDGHVEIGNPFTTFFNESDSLITIMEDEIELSVANEPSPITEFGLGNAATEKEVVSALVLGTQPILEAVLIEYAEYLHEASTVHVAYNSTEDTPQVSARTIEMLSTEGVNILFHSTNIDSRETLNKLLKQCEPDCVLVLADHGVDVEADDERTIRRLIYLREFRMLADRPFSITSEINAGLNKELVEATGPDDFIIGSHMSALLMAQISRQREIVEVFGTLLSSEGFEVYLKKAAWYLEPSKPVSLMTASRAVAERGEVFIGFRQKIAGEYKPAVINPSKYVSDMTTPRMYTFGEDDYFVVLAENGDYDNSAISS